MQGQAPHDDRDRVRSASDIVDVIGEQVSLRPKGREFVCLCPFHDDHSPSMYVVPAKQIFHCFVCGAGGDVFTFVQRFHKMEFPEALRFLADRAGIELTMSRPAEGGSSRMPLLEVNEGACRFFQAILRHESHGVEARALIERRGISPEMVDAFSIGASPDRWDGLVQYAGSHGLDARALTTLGLTKTRDSGGMYDAFRNRLVFPIRDRVGRVIAFGARRIDDADEPKYLNSPETPLFDKSATLYGLDRASRAIQRARCAVVTEGYTDVIACHQAGFEHVVATLGTALTTSHATVLRQMCDSVVLLFDGDEAGQRAAERAFEVFFGISIDVRIATLDRHTDCKDPDELLKTPEGVAVFDRVLAESEDILEFRFRRLRASLSGAGISATERALKDELSRLVSLGLEGASPARRALIVKRLAHVTGLHESVVRATIPAGRSDRRGSSKVSTGGVSTGGLSTGRGSPVDEGPGDLPGVDSRGVVDGRDRRPADEIVGCLLCDAGLVVSLTQEDWDLIDAYASPLVVQVAREIRRRTGTHEHLSLASLSDALSPDASGICIALARRVESESDASRMGRYLEDCLTRLRLDTARQVEVKTLDDRIEAIRARRAQGADRRVLPRASDAPGGSSERH